MIWDMMDTKSIHIYSDCSIWDMNGTRPIYKEKVMVSSKEHEIDRKGTRKSIYYQCLNYKMIYNDKLGHES